MNELMSPGMMSYATAFSLGLLGGAHCIGMCGGIMGALTFAIPPEAKGKRLALLLNYNAGRIASYTLMGLLLGLLSGFTGPLGGDILRLVSGCLLIAMGLYLANWWRGLTAIEKLGSGLWRVIQPLGKRLMPVTSSSQALLLGSLWGWLPCGLIYSALAYAAAQAEALAAAGVMLAFGLGTLPAVLASGLLAERLKVFIQNRGIRSLFASLIILFGIWTLWGTLQHSGHTGHGQQGDHSLHQGHPGMEQAPEVDSHHH